MTPERKEIFMKDLLARDASETVHIVACYRGDHTNNPQGGVGHCFACGAPILAYNVTLEKSRTEDWIILCYNECWPELVRRRNARGQPIEFGGRIANNRIPETK